MSFLFGLVALSVANGMPCLAGNRYYLSPLGNDKSDGRSLRQAWKSLAKLHDVEFEPGDEIVLAPGEYRGHIELTSGGTASRPVVVRSNASRPSTIVADGGFGIKASSGGIVVRDLILKGTAQGPDEKQSGIMFTSPVGIKERLPGIVIESVDVSGFGDAGISVGASDGGAVGYQSVTIRKANCHDNFGSGIETWDSSGYVSKGWAHRNLHIVDCEARRNHSGTGIVVSGFDGGLVEFCRASENVGKGGGVGIWAWSTRNVKFRYCISDRTRTAGGDGGGFDLDGGCQDCVMEHCLAYENYGPGFMHCDYPAAPPTKGNAFRHCVSVNDGRKPKGENIGFGFVTWGAGLDDCHIDQNLSVVTIDDEKARDQGLLFVSYIEGATKPSDVLHVRSSTFRKNLCLVLAKGVAYVNDRLPNATPEDVQYVGNRFGAMGALAPAFLKGAEPQRFGVQAEWLAGSKNVSKLANSPEAAEWLVDYRVVEPRALPNHPLMKAVADL